MVLVTCSSVTTDKEANVGGGVWGDVSEIE